MSKTSITFKEIDFDYFYPRVQVSKLLYPDDEPNIFFNRVKFVLRSIIYGRELKEVFKLFKHPQLAPIVEKYPELLDKPLRPYTFSKLKSCERARIIKRHYEHLLSNYPLLIPSLYIEDGICLGFTPDGKSKIVLRYDGTFRREGELSICILGENGVRLYGCAFTIFLTGDIKGIFIGSMQGPAPTVENPNDIVRALTKSCHGLRPKALLVMLVVTISKIMNFNHIYAVKRQSHVYQARRYSRKQKYALHTDYDELWSEFNALDVNSNFVELGALLRKDLSLIATNKRAMYRRRYMWIDDLTSNISEVLSSQIE